MTAKEREKGRHHFRFVKQRCVAAPGDDVAAAARANFEPGRVGKLLLRP